MVRFFCFHFRFILCPKSPLSTGTTTALTMAMFQGPQFLGK
jgi:hypothetical protein